MRLAALLVSVAVVGGCGSAGGGASSSVPRQESATSVATSVSSAGSSTSLSVPSLGSTRTSSVASSSPGKDEIRVTVGDGCPPSVGGHVTEGGTDAVWIANPDSAGLADSFVPGEPSVGLICRYAAVHPDPVPIDPNHTLEHGGPLYSATHLDRVQAAALAATLNGITPSDIQSSCVPPADNARYTAIVFALPGRSDVDVWLKDWIECPSVSNGVRSSGELINGHGSAFLAKLNALAPPAPEDLSHS